MILLDVSLISVLKTIAQIFTAGVAITGFALFLYAMAFNLRDRVARSFALILFFVVIIYTSEAIGSTSNNLAIALWWLRIKWGGIVFLPAAYLHFSDALLTLTGKPSRGRRRLVVKLVYIFSMILMVLVPLNILVGPLANESQPTPYLERNLYTNLFAVYYALIMIIAGYNLARAITKAITKTSRRRLIYLFAGATAPAIGTYLFLFHGSWVFSTYPIIFWSLLIIGCILVNLFLVILAYSVAFFGVTWTDRVVKARLFKWLLRGPFTASLALGMTTIVRRIGEFFGQTYTGFVPLVMVGTIVLFEYIITLLGPFTEKWLFYGSDRDDLSLIRSLEDHLLTSNDLKQFLEIIVASICDRLQVMGAFIAVFKGESIDYVIKAGDNKKYSAIQLNDSLYQEIVLLKKGSENSFFQWGDYLLLQLTYKSDQNGSILLGICGFPWIEGIEMDEEQANAVNLMCARATLALKDRQLQQQVMNSLEALQPQVNYIQQLRAVSRYDQDGILTKDGELPMEDFTLWVKDALVHFWGGPKLTESPLLNLRIVQVALSKHEGNYSNALREILKNAIEHVKPEGERRFTGEWVLYNILELKFLEGKKVREIASRLAMSEADLYRKQRVAIEAVAKAIVEMETIPQEANAKLQ
ncbi:MAG: hypothetical protein MUO40_11260 [Anaerolineaceae bacterium]|nr:hypothetical protein [Anaerolineaceae bacterium]